MAEAVDLYRTLADLSGLGTADIEPDVDGVSLAPLLQRGSDFDCWLQTHNCLNCFRQPLPWRSYRNTNDWVAMAWSGMDDEIQCTAL